VTSRAGGLRRRDPRGDRSAPRHRVVVVEAIDLAHDLGARPDRLRRQQAAAALLYGVGPADPSALAAGGVAPAVIAGMASVVPAHRAARRNPTAALREDP